MPRLGAARRATDQWDRAMLMVWSGARRVGVLLAGAALSTTGSFAHCAELLRSGRARTGFRKDRPMKNKGLGERFGRNLRSFWVTRRSLGDRGGPWSGSCEVDVAAVGRDRRDRGRFLRADDPRRGCRRRQLALGCARARADDVSKSRRQELVVCRATCVLLVSDLIYARSSVTLAPAFLAGAPASWSWTSRK